MAAVSQSNRSRHAKLVTPYPTLARPVKTAVRALVRLTKPYDIRENVAEVNAGRRERLRWPRVLLPQPVSKITNDATVGAVHTPWMFQVVGSRAGSGR
jgi:hypothetical protein